LMWINGSIACTTNAVALTKRRQAIPMANNKC
jgi:hypothetical protein